MSDDKIIGFPKNDERFLELAIQAFQAHDYQKAREYLEKIDLDDQTYQGNFIYMLVLFQLKEVKKSLEIAKPFKQQHLQKEDSAAIYVQVLLYNEQYIEAQAIIKEYQAKKGLADQKVWHDLENLANSFIQMSIAERQLDKKLSKKDLSSILDQPAQITYKEQELLFNELKSQPIASNLKMIEHILKQKDYPLLLRRMLLNWLVEESYDEEINIEWLGQELAVCPKDLDEMGTIRKKYQENDQDLNDLIEDPDPVMLMLLLDQNQLQLLILYPFTDLVITDFKRWNYLNIQKLYHQLDDLDEELTEADHKMMHWLNKIDEILAEMEIW